MVMEVLLMPIISSYSVPNSSSSMSLWLGNMLPSKDDDTPANRFVGAMALVMGLLGCMLSWGTMWTMVVACGDIPEW